MSKESPVAIFFEKDLCPKTYINSLYLSILGAKEKDKNKSLVLGHATYSSSAPSSTYSQESLALLSASISSLVAHLDHYTNELSDELGSCIQTLNQNSASLGCTIGLQSIESSPDTAYTSNRLQYYVSILKNAVINLESDLESVNQRINQQAEQYMETNSSTIDPISALGDLKQARENGTRVLMVFSTIRLLATSHHTGDIYSTTDFETILKEAHSALHDELMNSHTPELVDRVETLINLLAVFEGNSKFHPIYKRFCEKLQKSLAAAQDQTAS